MVGGSDFGRSQFNRVTQARRQSGSAFKPRTSPYSFQGLAEDGRKILAEIRKDFGLKIVTEAIDANVHTVDRELAGERRTDALIGYLRERRHRHYRDVDTIGGIAVIDSTHMVITNNANAMNESGITTETILLCHDQNSDGDSAHGKEAPQPHRPATKENGRDDGAFRFPVQFFVEFVSHWSSVFPFGIAYSSSSV